MSLSYDEDVVLAKASHVRRTVATIRSLSGPENAELKEWIRDDVTVLNLQRAVEALLDLANHLISANGWELPRDGRHAFAILRTHGLLTEPEQRLAAAMVGFRHLAATAREIADRREGQVAALERSLADAHEAAAGLLPEERRDARLPPDVSGSSAPV